MTILPENMSNAELIEKVRQLNSLCAFNERTMTELLERLTSMQQTLQQVIDYNGPDSEATLNACITYVVHGDADFDGMHKGLVSYFKDKVDTLRGAKNDA